MSDPRFRPKDYAVDPHEFGRTEEPEWRTVPEDEAHRLRAAVIQHWFALSVRDAMKRESGTLKALARRAGVSYDRMSRVLRGDAIMRLEDIAAADLLFRTYFQHVDAYLPAMSVREVPR